MMLGIQASLKSLIIFPEQRSADFTKQHYKQKYYFQLLPRRTTNSKDMFKICQFFDYAPYVFYEIRRIYGISNEAYLKSLGVEQLLFSIVKGDLKTPSQLVTSGKSGSLFYYSEDGQFTLKTISRTEFKYLKTIIKPYYEHFLNNNNSLMIPYFGLHKLQAKKIQSWRTKKIYFVIMKNVFFTAQEIHKRYDLKGSTFKRFTNDEDLTVARKDLNAIQDNFKLQLSHEDAQVFKQQLTDDCKFFEKNKLIDYSLLIGIHDTTQVQYQKQNSLENSLKQKLENSSVISQKNQMPGGRGIYYSQNKQYIYYIGIIDFLTPYNLKKQMEHAIKYLIQGKTISALAPKPYAQRFLNFMNQLINFKEKNHIPE